jgi:hypothetical protein
VSELASIVDNANTVYFLAGAGGTDEKRIKAVDYEGALKVFDAIETIKGTKPRLIMASSVDLREESKIPEYYVSTHTMLVLPSSKGCLALRIVE